MKNHLRKVKSNLEKKVQKLNEIRYILVKNEDKYEQKNQAL